MAKQFLAPFFICIAFACLLCFTTNSESRALANDENQVGQNRYPYVFINSEPVKPSTTYPHSPPGITFTLSDHQPRDIVVTNDDAHVTATPIASTSLQVKNEGGAAGTTWCIVKPSTNEKSLQQNIDYSCAHANCSVIKPGGACYEPKNIVSHASVAMNLFYKANGKNVGSCDFSGSGLIIIQDPSVGQCKYDPS